MLQRIIQHMEQDAHRQELREGFATNGRSQEVKGYEEI